VLAASYHRKMPGAVKAREQSLRRPGDAVTPDEQVRTHLHLVNKTMPAKTAGKVI
jgi:hypothetical protein